MCYDYLRVIVIRVRKCDGKREGRGEKREENKKQNQRVMETKEKKS